MRPTLCVLIVCALLSVGAADKLDWKFRDGDPTGENIRDVAQGSAESDTLTLVAVGDDNLILRSADGGSSWEHIPLPLPSPVAGTSNDIHHVTYFSSASLWLACGHAYNYSDFIIVSRNDGVSWEVSWMEPDQSAKYALFNGQTIVVYSGNSFVLISNDLAHTWQVVNATGLWYPNYLVAMGVTYTYADSPQFVAVANVYDNTSVFMVSPDGMNFKTVATYTDFTVSHLSFSQEYLTGEVDFYNEDKFYFLYCPLNDFQLAQNFSAPVLPAEWAALHFTDFYAGYEQNVWYFSESLTPTPSSSSSSSTPAGSTEGCVVAGSASEYEFLGCGQFNAAVRKVFFTSNGTLVAVGDNGVIAIGQNFTYSYEFSDASTAFSYDSFSNIMYVPAHAKFYMLGTSPGVWVSNSGHHWELCSIDTETVVLSSLVYSETVAPAVNNFFGIVYDGEYIYSTASTSHWSVTLLPEAAREHRPHTSAVAADGNTVVIACMAHRDPVTVRSVDGGNSWEMLINLQPSAEIVQLTAGNGLFVGATHHPHIWTTVNGSLWTKVAELPRGMTSLRFLNGQFVAALGNVVMTSDDGATWVNTTIPSPNAILSVQYGNSQYMIVGEGGLLVTSPNLQSFTVHNTTSYGRQQDVAFSEQSANMVVVGPMGLILVQEIVE